AFQRAIELFDSLEIKHILNDTLSYLFSDEIELLAPHDVAIRMALKTLTIYSSNEKETPEMIVQAFNFSTFSKIPEFVEFRDKLRHSIQRAISSRQVVRIEMMQRFPGLMDLALYLAGIDESALECDDEVLAKLSDNRDRTLMVNWRDGIKSVPEHIRGEEVPRGRDRWLRRYALIPKLAKALLAAHVQVPGATGDGAPSTQGALETCRQLCADLKADLEGEIEVNEKNPLESAPAHVLVKVWEALAPEGDSSKDQLAKLEEIVSYLEECEKKVDTAATPKPWMLSYDKLRNMMLFFEACNFAIIGEQLLLQPPASQQGGGKKSKNAARTIDPRIVSYSKSLREIYTRLDTSLRSAESTIGATDAQTMAKEIGVVLEGVSDETVKDTMGHVRESWLVTVKTLRLGVDRRLKSKGAV
ncbi:N-alpha-acetyltransferase 25, NatB auxiliary subunit, partial [Quaeritorhiza haematococci]